jgi:cbb3-type cytochrome oxidase subunit 3
MIEFLTQPIPAGVTLFLVLMVPFWAAMWWLFRRDRRRDAEYKRRWELQRQLWDMERRIWDERRSPEEIERDRQAETRAAEVRREARRRLGLPEEEG